MADFGFWSATDLKSVAYAIGFRFPYRTNCTLSFAPTAKMDKTKNQGTEDESGSDWAELTHECLINILARLSLEHRWRGMLVCKSWLHSCKDPSINSVFVLEPKSDSARWWNPDLGRMVDSILRSVADWSDGSLREIRTRNCSNLSLSFVAHR